MTADVTELAALTTLGVGGAAAQLVTPATRAELLDAVQSAWSEPEDWLLLGGGGIKCCTLELRSKETPV